MSIKRPSLKGMANTGHLGHFAQDKYIQAGHNFSGKIPVMGLAAEQKAANHLTALRKVKQMKSTLRQENAPLEAPEGIGIEAATPKGAGGKVAGQATSDATKDMGKSNAVAEVLKEGSRKRGKA